MVPGKELALTFARGTPPYRAEFEPDLGALEFVSPSPNQGKLVVRAAAPEGATSVNVRILDSAGHAAVIHLRLAAMPPMLVPDESPNYHDYIRPATRGLAIPLINGRSSGGPGPDVDWTEPLDEMERAVASCTAGDTVYLSAWFFEPATSLTVGGIPGVSDWGQLFAKKAEEDVKIRLLINDFDPISFRDWLESRGLVPLNAVIDSISPGKRDNLKYQVAMHPATVNALAGLIAGAGLRPINVASHHQKFMVVKRGDSLTAFCGGLDIESRKTPSAPGAWSSRGLVGWHDVHVQLEGPITRDFEREFVMRWNAERGNRERPPRPGWRAMEQLNLTPLTPVDDTAARKVHYMQMLRTTSVDGSTSPYSTRRDDIKRAYRAAIKGARSFLYLENQYFRDPELAEWIVEAGTANPALQVVITVINDAGADDGANAVTAHGNHLQHEFFKRVKNGLGSRVAFYTMTGRSVHSKLMLVDDTWMTIGSANANVRSFVMDSELNVQIADDALCTSFRHRLWSFALGTAEATVAGWSVTDFITEWQAVADFNKRWGTDLMKGEGVIPYDHNGQPGQRHGSIPDAIADLDFDTDDRTTGIA